MKKVQAVFRKTIAMCISCAMIFGLMSQMAWGDTEGGIKVGVEPDPEYRYEVFVKSPVGLAQKYIEYVSIGKFLPGDKIVFSVPSSENGESLRELKFIPKNYNYKGAEPFVKVDVDENNATVEITDKSYGVYSKKDDIHHYRHGKMGMVYEDIFQTPATAEVKVDVDAEGRVTKIEVVKGDHGKVLHDRSYRSEYNKFFKDSRLITYLTGKTYEEIANMDFKYSTSKDYKIIKPSTMKDKPVTDRFTLNLIALAVQEAVLDALGREKNPELSQEGLQEYCAAQEIHTVGAMHYVHVLVNKDGRIVNVWDSTREDLRVAEGGIFVGPVNQKSNQDSLKKYRAGFGYGAFVGLHKDEVNDKVVIDAISGATQTAKGIRDAVVKALENETFPEASLSKTKYTSVPKSSTNLKGEGKAYLKKVIMPGMSETLVERIIFEETKDTDASPKGNNVIVQTSDGKKGEQGYQDCKFNYTSGSEVKISSPSKDGKKQPFSHWEVISGNVSLEKSDDINTSFTMGNETVKIKAVYGVSESPKFVSAEVLDSNKTQVLIKMDTKLKAVSETSNNASDFQVQVAGAEFKAVRNYAISGQVVTLNLSDGIEVQYGDTVKVKYKDSNGIIKSDAGNAPAKNFEKNVENKVQISTADLDIESAKILDNDRNVINIAVRDNLDTNVSPTKEDFSITVGAENEIKSISNINIEGSAIKITLEETAKIDWRNIKVSYTGNSKWLKLSDGKIVNNFEKNIDNQIVAPDLTIREIVIQNYNPRKIVIIFDKDMKAIDATDYNLTDFTVVKGENDPVELENYKVQGRELILQLAKEAESGAAYKVSYNNQHSILKSADGSQTKNNFQDQLVTNNVKIKKEVVLVIDGEESSLDKKTKGSRILIEAPEEKNGKKFVKWVVKSGDIVLENVNARKTNFVMGELDVRIEAEYAEETQPKNPKITGIEFTQSIQEIRLGTDNIKADTVLGTLKAKGEDFEENNVIYSLYLEEGAGEDFDAPEYYMLFKVSGNQLMIKRDLTRADTYNIKVQARTDYIKKVEDFSITVLPEKSKPKKKKDTTSTTTEPKKPEPKIEPKTEKKTETVESKVETKAAVDTTTGKAEAKIDNAKVKEQLADMVKQAEKVEKDGKKEVVKELKLEVKADKAAKAVEAVIPKEAVKNMAEKADAVKIDTNLGTVSLDKKVLADLSAKADKEVSVVLEKKEVSDTPLAKAKAEDVKKAEGRPIVELKATVDGKAASVKGNVNLSLKYEKQSSEQAEAVVVYKVLPNGAMQIVKESDFDAAKAEVKIDVKNAEGTYVIGYNNVEFTDANSHWAEKNITFLAAREVVKGKEAGKFVPESKVSRAEFAQILANLSGADLSKYNASNFTDVASDSWYAAAVAWATEMGITGGVGDGNFAPEAAISRQDMAVMIERYLKSGDRNLKAKKKEVKFADASNVASYAQNAVATMQRAGIINGAPAANGTLNFNPTASASRAETVTMIANYIRN